MLHGGEAGPTVFSDTWEFDGVSWARLPSGPSPGGRSKAAMVFHGGRGRVELFGGFVPPPANTRFADTWELAQTPAALFLGLVTPGATSVEQAQKGVSVTAIVGNAGSRPAALSNAALRFSTSFGADVSSGYTVRPAANNPTTVTTVSPVTLSFAVDVGSAAQAGFTTIQAVVTGADSVSGAPTSATSSDRPANWTVNSLVNWTLQSPGTRPSPRSAHAAVYDSARERVVVFGGVNRTLSATDTWEWDGSNWSQRSTTGPSARSGHGMAFDSRRKRTVLSGGGEVHTYFDDTWAWDGTNWKQVSPATAPTPRVDAAISYDSARDRVVVFGVYQLLTNPFRDDFRNELDEFDGTNWSLPNGQAGPRSSARRPAGSCASELPSSGLRTRSKVFVGGT
ncbi:MAG: hypothetical protein HY303_06945 [Candidatus Wallbacteria bacterium]|nr:hypothetical protein [Candidatus Wallbacteria bacterium]